MQGDADMKATASAPSSPHHLRQHVGQACAAVGDGDGDEQHLPDHGSGGRPGVVHDKVDAGAHRGAGVVKRVDRQEVGQAVEACTLPRCQACMAAVGWWLALSQFLL